MTRHANIRSQQRGVPPLVLEWLLEYGAVERQPGGTQLRFFDKTARRRLERRCGRSVVSRLDDFLSAYAVTADDTVVTTGWRTKRVRRH